MSELQSIDIPEGAVLMSEVRVVRYMCSDGEEGVSLGFESHTGRELGPIEILGMLHLAQHYTLSDHFDESDED